MLQTATAPERRHACLVEDDPDMRGMLERFLCQHGFRVTALEDAEALLERVRRGALSPDAIVLDQSLPGMTGREACQWLRREGHQVPVLMLSASDDEIDRVLGLELGADDFVGKPFSARELLARLNALIRRAQGAGPGAAQGPGTQVRIGDAVFLPLARQLLVDEQPRTLSTVEHALLSTLCARPGEVISRQALFDASHSRDDKVLLRAVDSAIVRLRRLVEPDPAEPRFIQTVRGQGYLFVPQPRRRSWSE